MKQTKRPSNIGASTVSLPVTIKNIKSVRENAREAMMIFLAMLEYPYG
jgi:hypothetical protein